MNLSWSQNSNGNWNGKRGPYTIMALAYHDPAGWWIHPKLPGLKGKQVADEEEGKKEGGRLFNEWLVTMGLKFC